jgi:transcriptional antiterminator NusG
MGREQVTGIRKMVDEEDKVEDLVLDAPEAETAEAPVVKATEVETAEAPVLEATETAEAPAVETDEIETAEAAVVEAEADEAPVVEAIAAETAEAIEDESVTAESDLAAAAEASESAPVEAPVAEATEVPAAEAAVAAAAVKKEPASNRRWYVVHAYSGFESYVKKVLESRIATSEHKKKFGDIMVPTEEVVEMREGNRRKSERKFFPGYVLVQMEMDSDTWHLVKQVPKVLGFIGGTSDKPAPISEAEADAILNRVEEGVDKPRPKVLFEVGEVVRVNDGPFNDFNGVVEEVNYEKSKMLVSVQIFGRSTPVELAFGQVEKG